MNSDKQPADPASNESVTLFASSDPYGSLTAATAKGASPAGGGNNKGKGGDPTPPSPPPPPAPPPAPPAVTMTWPTLNPPTGNSTLPTDTSFGSQWNLT